MIARSKQISLIDQSRHRFAYDDAAVPSFTAAFFAAAFAFLCFFPYPAISVGNNSALQIGNVATLLALLCTSASLWQSVGPVAALLVMMPMVSTLKVLVIDNADASVCFKQTAVSAISLLTLLAVQLHAPRHALAMLVGVAFAILVHVAVGLLQLYSFSSGVFPLAEIYVNPSFLSVQDNAQTIARWIQRPFGLFPEPSAMSCSLAPFVLFFAAVGLDVIRMKNPPTRWQRALFASAAAGGLGLIIVSRSGHAVPTVAAMALLMILWTVRARATAKTYSLLLSLFCVALPLVLVFAISALSSRVAGGSELGNDSWEERTNSLLIGFRLWSDHGLATVLLGMGPGITSAAVNDVSGIAAVFSILFAYVYDTGLLGLTALIWVGHRMFLSWRQAQWSIAFFLIAIVWTIGVSVTTSYSQLLPIWVALGLLSCWNEICEAPSKRQTVVRRMAVAKAATRGEGWISPWAAAGNGAAGTGSSD
jgi:hypothetical protein